MISRVYVLQQISVHLWVIAHQSELEERSPLDSEEVAPLLPSSPSSSLPCPCLGDESTSEALCALRSGLLCSKSARPLAAVGWISWSDDSPAC
jgi:hypothetical protein